MARAIPPTLVHSELFGHKKGAFTGATEAGLGAFQAANGGTLFLDEIGELPLDVQPVLLRALEERVVTPLGETRARPVRVRVLAATNRSLHERIGEGLFREDLYYRLNVVTLKVPPLRERPEDVALLASVFAKNAGVTELPASIIREICARSWPGNARELRHAVDCYLVMGALPGLSPLPRAKFEQLLSEFADLTRPYQELKETLVEAFTRSYVSRLVASTGGNVSEASRISGLERSYLNKLTHRFGVKK
jgi:transcriptional regulator with GAF, ATPase, and Fis domain